MKFTARHTLYAAYLGYIMQAIVNNLPPLLFVTFQRQFDIPLAKISLLITINFFTQIMVDFFGAKVIDRIGYRIPIVAAHVFSTCGLVLLGILPYCMDPFTGIVIAMLLNAIGGGLTEVLVSPIVESLPGDEKASAMSLLHSFYCWGHMAVVILSTIYFSTAGTENWRWLPILWAVIPAFNTWFFTQVPLYVLVEEEKRVPLGTLLTKKIFWVFFVLMLCAGASEQAMSQWSSLFAETGLGVSKTMGDLLGPCAFACLMGTSRALYGVFGKRMNLRLVIAGSSVLCILAYLLTVFSPYPLLSLIGCAICGFSVGIMWPGTFSLAQETYPVGGTAMFAILALAGDMGCGGGPGLVGVVSDLCENGGLAGLRSLIPSDGTEACLKAGMLVAILFPVLMFTGIAFLRKKAQRPAH